MRFGGRERGYPPLIFFINKKCSNHRPMSFTRTGFFENRQGVSIC